MFCEVKFTFAIFDEWFCSLELFLVIIWLHGNPPHAFCTPVCLKNVFILRSNRANTSDYITPSFNYSNRVINCGVQDSVRIGFCKWKFQIFLSGFNLILKYGAYHKWKSISPIKEWSYCPISGILQYLIILNIDCAGLLPHFMI